jgi:hypothetical protein
MCGVVSGDAAPAIRAITATISVEQKRTEMFVIFPYGTCLIWEARRKPNVIMSLWHDRGTCW